MQQPLPSGEEIMEKDMNVPIFNPFSEGSADDPLPVDYLSMSIYATSQNKRVVACTQ